MYYKEEIINGVLCYKLSPNAEWKEFEKYQLTTIISDLKIELKELREKLEETNQD